MPQVVLGAAFGLGIPMAFSAVTAELPLIAWLLYFAKISWTVAYDTMYAMVDRDDDLKIGVKSTAILFGRFDNIINGFLQCVTLLLLAFAGLLANLGSFFFIGLMAMSLFFIYQQVLTRNRLREQCFKAFLNNHFAGLTVFIALMLDYL